MLHTLRSHRIFFGGDAAHIHSPAGGQGMNTGIQDMINLSWKLAMVYQGKATPELLNTYEEERLPIIRAIVSRTEAATDALNSDNPIVHQFIALIAPVLLNTHFVQQLSTGLISEVAANYRASSLSQTHHDRGNLRAGDRVPDLDVSVWDSDSGNAQPREAHLYNLLDPSHFTLLLVGDRNKPDDLPPWEEQLSPWQRILSAKRITSIPTQGKAKVQFHSCFGSDRSFILVRPDSYVGFVGDRDALPALIKWLNQWFSSTANRSN